MNASRIKELRFTIITIMRSSLCQGGICASDRVRGWGYPQNRDENLLWVDRVEFPSFPFCS